MQLLQKLLNKFNGLHYKQEFLCLDRSSFKDPLNLHIVSENRIIKNITGHHLFVGYCPVVFCFPSIKEIDLGTEKLEIIFSQNLLSPNETINEKDVVARIYFKKLREQSLTGKSFYYYEGEQGSHKFVSLLAQQVLELHNKLYNKKPGNVYLADNLLKQVQIAYSFPRNISLITVGMNDRYNLFPTDLHGEIDNGQYIISLRHGGKAAEQVLATKKILISEVKSDLYKSVYSLGKNHMQELKAKNNFPFADQHSTTYQLPLPQSVTIYRELELQEWFDHGIHRFFLFRILDRKHMEDNINTLAHIHNVYATWRHNKGLAGNYLLR